MEVQRQNQNRNADGRHTNYNGNGGNSGPMRSNRNNRNNVRKPYNNEDSAYRSKYYRIFESLIVRGLLTVPEYIFLSDRNEMNSSNQLGGFFSEFDDRRGNRNGNRLFPHGRGVDFRNQQANEDFSRRSNNDTNNRFNSPTPSGNRFTDHSDRWMGFKPDLRSGGCTSNDGNASNRLDFGGDDYGGNSNDYNSGNDFGGNRNDIIDMDTVHRIMIRGMPFYCDENDVHSVSCI